MPTTTMGSESNCPIVPRAEEVADLHVGKAHELDEDAEDAVEREEGARKNPRGRGGSTCVRQGEEHETPQGAPHRAARDGT